METIAQIILLSLALPPILGNPLYQKVLELVRLNKRPLNCPTCLGLWTSLILHLTLWPTPILIAVIASLSTATLTELLDRHYNSL